MKSPSLPVAVLIVDAEPLSRRGLAGLLGETGEYRVAGAVEGIVQGREFLQRKEVGLVVLDVALDGGEVLAFIEECRRRRPVAGVVVLTAREHPDMVREALSAGALGYVSKRDAEGELLRALGEARAGERHLSPRVEHRFLADVAAGAASAPLGGVALTGQQREIMHRLAGGKVTRVIAEELRISPKTVETHCRRLRERLGLRSQRELLLLAAKWAGGGGG